MLLAMGFLLLVSLLFSALLATMSHYLHTLIPSIEMVWIFLDFIISTLAITFLFAIIFKILAHNLAWPDVFLGAFFTALLFSLGKFFLSIYLARSNVTTMYGAAASLVGILVWVYYSAQILLFGAEFTKAYTYQFGSRQS